MCVTGVGLLCFACVAECVSPSGGLVLIHKGFFFFFPDKAKEQPAPHSPFFLLCCHSRVDEEEGNESWEDEESAEGGRDGGDTITNVFIKSARGREGTWRINGCLEAIDKE